MGHTRSVDRLVQVALEAPKVKKATFYEVSDIKTITETIIVLQGRYRNNVRMKL